MEKLTTLIDNLALKQQENIKIIKKLQEENKRLVMELNFHKKENEKNRKSINSYEILKKNVENSVVKVERLLQKIDTAKEQKA
jgi:hypothetical protein